MVGFLFFMGAMTFGMIYTHPGFLMVSALFSTLYYVSLTGRGALRQIRTLVMVFIVISLVNPLVNTLGETVIFTYFNGRPYTREALYYGMATGGMFYTMIMWFKSYHLFMSSDRYHYLFRKIIPAASLILIMVQRLLPMLQMKFQSLIESRRAIGKEEDPDNRKERLVGRALILSVLMGWAMEGSMITADSMTSRGYGLGGRTSFSLYRVSRKDKLMLIVNLTLIFLLIFTLFQGVGMAKYIPRVRLPKMDVFTCGALGLYAFFLALPLNLNISEEIKWRILTSKI